jgi:UPF0716 protein FxsA
MQAGIRRRAPWWLLAVLFVVVPLLELVLLIRLGQVVGAWWTILILVAAAVLGSWLVKREGSRAWRALQEAIAAHRMPAAELADGALILVGGTLLITPGFISDLAGLFCILPFTRPAARGVLARLITRRLTLIPTAPGGFGTKGGPAAHADPRTRSGPGGQGGADTQRRPGHGDVIRGDVVDRD